MGGEARGRLLGLDVGERRIGVAVSEGRVAVPLTIVQHTNRADDIARINEIARSEGARAIVVGLPVSISGEEREQARLTRKFGDDLARAVDVPVIFHDERYSTVAASVPAEELLPAKPQRRRGRAASPAKRRPVDDRAAAVILQSYLDAQEQAP